MKKRASDTPAVRETPTPAGAALLASLRSAATLDEAVAILQPDQKRRLNVDAVYEVVESVAEPLPQKRGVSNRVYAVAARLNRPFKVAEVEGALPDVKSAAYWTRKLAALGFLKVTP
jgi:hypothetical protein